MADEPRQMVEEAVLAVEKFGLRLLCVKAGHPKGLERDIENFAAVRKALGKSVMLGIDPNEAWNVDATIRALTQLEPYEPAYLEQPIARRNIDGLREVRRHAKGLPLIADESLFTLEDAFELARSKAVDALCIKLYKVGGLRVAKKIAAVAESAHMGINAGGVCAFCQLEAAATAHFCASVPPERIVGAAEFVFGLGVFGPDPLVTESSFVIRDGCATIPDRAGLGITINEKELANLTLRREILPS